jgi:hypothetical protein
MHLNRLYIIIAIVSIISLLVFSCYYDSEEALYPTLTSSCDTTNVTFSGTIVPILSGNCYSCHSNANAGFGGNIRLEAITDVRSISAKLIIAIKQTGAKPMPPSGKLKACSITQFEIWVRNGMLK